MDCGCGDARGGLHPTNVEAVSVRSVTDGDFGTLITVGVHQHGREHETEEGGRDNKALLHSIGHCKGFRQRSVVCDARHHPVMELSYHVGKVLRTAKLLHNFQKSGPVHRVEGFCQVHEHSVEVSLHLLTFLLQLTCGKYHVSGAAVTSKTTLAFRQESLLQMVIQMIGENASKDFTGNIQQ
ncbi:unnamed protein product [Dibothriocephalus latus]|uniref:Uncharacterized protein n=1 Tax=Dibothriocephalus latus TaxID=60516 RepID=A0A3P7RL39_DIBLA|nr:unnamed protein product [Dibothriocephalus latus]